ncbi:MAG: hypothetical protein IKU32_08230 [Clostridia bacterium]|nr:hypothetical protein [Clostridia bacterium]
MKVELTQLSSNEYQKLISERMTPAMAASYLKEQRIVLRSFVEMLRGFYPAGDILPRLISAFMAADPRANADSVSRKIRNWLSGKNRPTGREDIFQIAFALELTEAQASYLLGLCTDFGIHYREGREAVYAWFLRMGYTYMEARDFFDTLPPITYPDVPPKTTTCHLTRELQTEFMRIQTTEELRACYVENLGNFGQLHMRAYYYFNKYLDQLIHPAPAWGGTYEPDYSMESIMQQYLSFHIPSGKDRKNYSVVQKLIKHNWPNTTALKNIRNQKEDVPRKLLLLLYVITENIMDSAYHETDEEYVTLEERVDDHWWSLNALLTDCGMPLLDPRNPTDWLVLYAIAAEDEPMSERMEQVIEHIYSDV